MNLTVDTAFWQYSDEDGFRSVMVYVDNKKVFSIRAIKYNAIWTSSIVSMGYSFSVEQLKRIKTDILIDCMKLLERNNLTLEEIEQFTENRNVI